MEPREARKGDVVTIRLAGRLIKGLLSEVSEKHSLILTEENNILCMDSKPEVVIIHG